MGPASQARGLPTIDILRHAHKPRLAHGPGQCSKGTVSVVGLGMQGQVTSVSVKEPHKPRIPAKCVEGGQLGGIVPPPEAAGAAKGGQAGGGGEAGPTEGEDAAGGTEGAVEGLDVVEGHGGLCLQGRGARLFVVE